MSLTRAAVTVYVMGVVVVRVVMSFGMAAFMLMLLVMMAAPSDLQ